MHRVRWMNEGRLQYDRIRSSVSSQREERLGVLVALAWLSSVWEIMMFLMALMLRLGCSSQPCDIPHLVTDFIVPHGGCVLHLLRRVVSSTFCERRRTSMARRNKYSHRQCSV